MHEKLQSCLDREKDWEVTGGRHYFSFTVSKEKQVEHTHILLVSKEVKKRHVNECNLKLV
jgi:hypothetical protein